MMRAVQLSAKVPLHDVLDTEAFVRATIAKGHLRLSIEDREELVCEGIAIMARLAKIYEPGRNGLNPSESKFSGFAAKYLPGKMSDANHRLQESHRLTTNPETGKRSWTYGQPAASLDAIVDGTGTDHIRELRTEDEYDCDMAHTLRGVLDERWPHDREVTVKIAVLMGSDYSLGDAAKVLGVDAREATLAFERICVVRHRLKTTLLAA